MRLNLQHPPTPENASKLAQIVVDVTKNVENIDLDYSPDSLRHVDQIVNRFHDEGLTENQIGETVFTFGCYVGEILVRNNAGVWKLPKQSLIAKFLRGDENMMVVELPNGTVCNPIGKTFKLLSDGSTESVAYFYQVFTKIS